MQAEPSSQESIGQLEQPPLPPSHSEPEEQRRQQICEQYGVEEHIIHAVNVVDLSLPLWYLRAVIAGQRGVRYWRLSQGDYSYRLASVTLCCHIAAIAFPPVTRTH